MRGGIDADRSSLLLGVEAGHAKALAKVTDAYGRPGLTVCRLAAHPVHGDREIAVRPLATELADDLDRTPVSIGGAAVMPTATSAEVMTGMSVLR